MLYSNKVLPLFILAMTINLRSLQETNTGYLPYFCCYFHFGGQSESESLSVVSDSLWPHGLYSPWNSSGQNTGVGRLSLLQGIFPTQGKTPGIEPRSPSLQADSLPAEPQGKPKNTEVGSLSLLQRIFPTQESNWGLLHSRWILYQVSHQGSPKIRKLGLKESKLTEIT